MASSPRPQDVVGLPSSEASSVSYLLSPPHAAGPPLGSLTGTSRRAHVNYSPPPLARRAGRQGARRSARTDLEMPDFDFVSNGTPSTEPVDTNSESAEQWSLPSLYDQIVSSANWGEGTQAPIAPDIHPEASDRNHRIPSSCSSEPGPIAESPALSDPISDPISGAKVIQLFPDQSPFPLSNPTSEHFAWPSAQSPPPEWVSEAARPRPLSLEDSIFLPEPSLPSFYPFQSASPCSESSLSILEDEGVGNSVISATESGGSQASIPPDEPQNKPSCSKRPRFLYSAYWKKGRTLVLLICR
jgi:hypothetical protein